VNSSKSPPGRGIQGEVKRHERLRQGKIKVKVKVKVKA
jgi:hypothetical protein